MLLFPLDFLLISNQDKYVSSHQFLFQVGQSVRDFQSHSILHTTCKIKISILSSSVLQMVTYNCKDLPHQTPNDPCSCVQGMLCMNVSMGILSSINYAITSKNRILIGDCIPIGCAFFNTTGGNELHSTPASDHRNGHVDAQVAIIRKQLGNTGVKDKTVRVHYCRRDSFMD